MEAKRPVLLQFVKPLGALEKITSANRDNWDYF